MHKLTLWTHPGAWEACWHWKIDWCLINYKPALLYVSDRSSWTHRSGQWKRPDGEDRLWKLRCFWAQVAFCDYAPICLLINNSPFCFVHISEYTLHFITENGAMCMCYACMEREKRVLAVVYSEERVYVKVGQWKLLFVFLIHFI